MDSVLSHVDWSVSASLPAERPKHSPFDSPFNALSLVLPGLFLTAEKTAADRSLMIIMGVRLVVKMNAESNEPPYQVYEFDEEEGSQVHHALERDVFYQRLWEELQTLDEDRAMAAQVVFVRAIPALDSPTYDIAQHFMEVCSLLELIRSRRVALAGIHEAAVTAGKVVLPAATVHCLAGVSRSASVVISYLMKRYGLSHEQATQYAKEARPIVSPNTGFCSQLILWESCNGNRITDLSSAKLAASEMLRTANSERALLERLKAQFHVMCATSRLHDDRRLIGLLLRAVSTDATGGTLQPSSIAHALLSVVLEGIDDEVYVDSPDFLRCFVGITASLKQFAPAILAADVDADDEGRDGEKEEEGHDPNDNKDSSDSTVAAATRRTGEESAAQTVFLGGEDQLHHTVLYHIEQLPSPDPPNTVELLARYVRALVELQVGLRYDNEETPSTDATTAPAQTHSSSSAPPVFLFRSHPDVAKATLSTTSANDSSSSSSSCSTFNLVPIEDNESVWYLRPAPSFPVALTLCVLPAFARLAEGFVAWKAMEELVPSEIMGGPNALLTVVASLRKELKDKFLLVRWDGAVGAIGTQQLRRWDTSSSNGDALPYLHALRRDLEVIVFELWEMELADQLSTPHLTRKAGLTRLQDCLKDAVRTHVAPALASTWSVPESVQVSFGQRLAAVLKRKLVSGIVSFHEMQSSIVRCVLERVRVVQELPSPTDRGTSPIMMMMKSSSSNNNSLTADSMPPALVSVAHGCGVVPLDSNALSPSSPLKKSLQYSPPPPSTSRRTDRSPSMSYSGSEPPTPVRSSFCDLPEEGEVLECLGEAEAAALWETPYAVSRRCERSLLQLVDELFVEWLPRDSAAFVEAVLISDQLRLCQ